MKNCRLGPSAVTVQGEGFAPECEKLTVQKENPPLSFRLEPGATLRGRVVDRQGKPLDGIWVYADTWRDLRTLTFRATTDNDGRFVWTNAPRDTVIFSLSAKGFMSDRNRPLTASDDEHTITLYPELLIHGTVEDEETGEPIAQFQYCSGFRRDTERESFFSNQFKTGKNGRFDYQMPDASMPNIFVKVVAEGYNPAISRAFQAHRRGAVVRVQTEERERPWRRRVAARRQARARCHRCPRLGKFPALHQEWRAKPQQFRHSYPHRRHRAVPFRSADRTVLLRCLARWRLCRVLPI